MRSCVGVGVPTCFPFSTISTRHRLPPKQTSNLHRQTWGLVGVIFAQGALVVALIQYFKWRAYMLTIYGRKSSFNVQKVMWLIGELGVGHSHIELGGSFGGVDTPEFRTLNPHGRVPVIDDDGTIVWESHAILRYIAARYGSGTFWSDDPAQRSLADRWMD